ncbi:glutaminyl-peptide cyclotransferase [Corynebacterium choanae]|uniref:Glutamine cyclotransferase n=1 Tax=Corynebacterium choanae TaxID=1862358 RepID=A0A3G6JAN4_9CORY|nr:glutaminyl-peptide cyclotransferase [Corynebacterium choanae]AZA13024.1 Glutamine cyclotransferase [Corynebacterium choanae]
MKHTRRILTSLLFTVAGIAAATSGCTNALTVAEFPTAASSSSAQESRPDLATQEQRLAQHVNQYPQVVQRYPFDAELFTQGLDTDGQMLVIGSGLYEKSTIQRTTPGAAPQVQVALADDEFGEGVAVTPAGIWQLTWRNHIAYLRDLETLTVRSTVDNPREGWGVCYDETSHTLLTSDGTSTLVVRDAETFAELRTFTVTLAGEPIDQLNELDCTDGIVRANVWLTPYVVTIDPASGEVTGVADISSLYPESVQHNNNAVANGVASISGSDEFYVTGKLWPTLYRVRFTEEPAHE